MINRLQTRLDLRLIYLSDRENEYSEKSNQLIIRQLVSLGCITQASSKGDLRRRDSQNRLRETLNLQSNLITAVKDCTQQSSEGPTTFSGSSEIDIKALISSSKSLASKLVCITLNISFSKISVCSLTALFDSIITDRRSVTTYAQRTRD